MTRRGRFAPSPSGDLHVGNLRTAALAWLVARSSGREFLLRVEDLDAQRCRPEYAQRQLDDLRAIGITSCDEIVRQSDRTERYRAALDHLTASGQTFECYCSRRDIREAQSAPHADPERYPGTCRDLGADGRARRRRDGRPPAIRLRGGAGEYAWCDQVLGPRRGVPDDVVLRRWDGALAYNLAVVVDDLAQGVDQVVRGDDLVGQTPTQLRLIDLLGGAAPAYAHVPLVVNAAGARLAKRDGAVTLADLAASGVAAEDVVRLLLRSLGDAVPREATTLSDAAAGFDLARLPRSSWTFVPPGGC